LTPQSRPGGLAGRRVVLLHPAAGQGRGASGGAVLGLTVLGELRVGGQGLGVKPGRGGMKLAVGRELGVLQELGGAGRAGGAAQDGGQAGGQGGLPLD
jgi:hypothetical protein